MASLVPGGGRTASKGHVAPESLALWGSTAAQGSPGDETLKAGSPSPRETARMTLPGRDELFGDAMEPEGKIDQILSGKLIFLKSLNGWRRGKLEKLFSGAIVLASGYGVEKKMK
ncbi:hypothetical protein JRQ81_007603 [Phrynocephalus forsythii]|uniref:Uncharacterized protein n=1 Tax=Phrynocephalus forsythii TaxID=171643 RepID=A0A9Q0XDW5_9SAUR|nr:hypothetical protein JRQ81_007603 [Phrynocephalus forsythii]